MGPPTVVLDHAGAEVLYVQLEQPRIDWWQVQQIAVDVVTAPELDYSEAFWTLTGDGVTWGAPVDIVVGADELKDRLFAFKGFDARAYDDARRAEAEGKAGSFICWQLVAG